VVRPTITYGCKIWAAGERGKPPPARLLQPLVRLQNKCLRKVTGAYKRAPTKALEKDAAVEPLPLHIQSSAMGHALKSEAHPVVEFIRQTCDRLWGRYRPRRGQRPQRPPTPTESLLGRAKAAAKDAVEIWKAKAARRQPRHNGQRQHRGPRPQRAQAPTDTKTLMRIWRESKWKEQWLLAAQGKQTPVWKTPWETHVPKLHAALSKPESTMATLLRTEAIGLNDFLHRVGVPGVEAKCPCGWERQTPKHAVMYCAGLAGRDRMLDAAGTTDYTTLLNTGRGLRAVARWLLQQGVLPQFSVAREMAREDRSGWRPLSPLG
jgi:hypothetical protein